MTLERDELAMELFIADNFKQPREQSIVDWEWFNETPRFTVRIEHYKNMADGAIAAGYSRPRTIKTVEELDALGINSAVLSNGDVYVNDGVRGGEPWASLVEHSLAGPIWVDSGALTLPATLLHAGATK